MFPSKILRPAGLVTLLLAGVACKDAPRPPPSASPPKPVPGAEGIGQPAAAAPPAAAPPAAPATAGYQGALASSLAVADGATLGIGFHDQESVDTRDQLDRLVLRLARDGKTVWQRDGFLAVADLTAVPDLFERCDTIAASVRAERWGEAGGARVSVTCRSGEDAYTGSEHATLLELDGTAAAPYPPLWSGEADVLQEEHGACTETTTVTIAVAGTTLTRRTVDEARGPRSCRQKPRTRTEASTVTRRGATKPSIPAALTRLDATGTLGFSLDDDLPLRPAAPIVVKPVGAQEYEVWVGQERQLVVHHDGNSGKTISAISVVGRLPRLANGHGVGSGARDFEDAGKVSLNTSTPGRPCATFAKLPDLEVCFDSEAKDLNDLMREDDLVTSIELIAPGEGEGEEE